MSVAPGIQRSYWKPMSEKEWIAYYGMNQTGKGMSFFRGSQYQRGNGFGSLFSGLLRAVMPVAKSALKTVGKQALKTGLSVASDTLAGENIGDAFEHHGKAAAGKLVKKASRKLTGAQKKKGRKQTGRGVGTLRGAKRPTGAKRINRSGGRKKTQKTDFFNF